MSRTSFVVGKPAYNVYVDVGRKQMPVNSGQYLRYEILVRSEIRCVGDWRVIGQVTLKTPEQPPYISRMLGSTGGVVVAR
jgi:hypothetical protein